MEKAKGAIWRQGSVSQNWRRLCQFFCKPHDYHDRIGAVLCTRFVWHSVADDSSRIDVDEDSHS